MAKKFIILFSLFSIFLLSSQIVKSQEKIFRKNTVKLNLLPVTGLFNGHNQKWVGIEYERFISKRISFAVLLNAGLFEDYTFIKYHDYFDEQNGFSYTKTDITTRGYHAIPSMKYSFLVMKKSPQNGFYILGNMDFNQYFGKSHYYYSLTGESGNSEKSTTRLSIGTSLGGRYIFFSRLVVEANIAVYARLFAFVEDKNQEEIEPLHATWKFKENKGWATINVMIGYAFGGGKQKK